MHTDTDADWVSKVITFLSLSSVPLFTTALYILFRAYKKSVEAHMEIITHLKKENSRLRKHLDAGDERLFHQIERFNLIVSNSVETINRLEVIKTEPRAERTESSNQIILDEIQKVNKAFEQLQNLPEKIESLSIQIAYGKSATMIEESVVSMSADEEAEGVVMRKDVIQLSLPGSSPNKIPRTKYSQSSQGKLSMFISSLLDLGVRFGLWERTEPSDRLTKKAPR